MPSTIPISAVIIFKDDMDTLPDTLGSLYDFREVLIYDNGPTPDLAGLCTDFPNVRIETGEFMGFGPTRNHAASLAQFDWILAIDADECLDRTLCGAISGLSLEKRDVIYRLRRDNYFLGKRLRFGSQTSDKIIRLYHRDYAAFNNAMVHEKVTVTQRLEIQVLPGRLIHNPISSLYESIQKMNTYTEAQAEAHPFLAANSLQATGHAAWGFFRSYVLFLGILDGWRGLACAVGEANGRFYKYMKRVARQDTSGPDSQNHSETKE